MSRSKKKMVAFRTLPCLGCRATRIVGNACDECGRKGPSGEVNTPVVDRRTAVARVNAAFTALGSQINRVEDNPSLPSKDELLEIVENFVEAFSGILESPKSLPAISGMAYWLKSFESMRSQCAALPKLRPRVALQRSLSTSFDVLSELWPTYSQVLSAPTISEATLLTKRGQELLNSAFETLKSHEELVNAARVYEDLSIQDQTERILTALAISHPTLSFLEMGRHGKLLAEAKTHVATDEAHGIQYLVLDTITSVHMDPERFNDVLATTARFCLANDRLHKIAGEDGALETLASSQRLLYESLASFEAVLARENDEKAIIRRVIKFYGEFYEDVVSPILAWYSLLAAIKHQPYAKLLREDATKLAKGLLGHPLTASFLEDSGANLRNAAQHGNSFSIEGDHVRFKLRSYEETVSTSKVINDVFSLFESISAMSWSLSSALSQAGYSTPLGDEDATYMKLSAFHMAKFHLKRGGTPVLWSEELDSSWSFVLNPEQDNVFELALSLTMGAPDRIRKVVLQAATGETPLLVPLNAYHRISMLTDTGAHPADHLMALLELRNDSTVNGHSLLKTSDLKFAAGSLGIPLILKKDSSVIPHLRRVRTLASVHGSQKIDGLIKNAFQLYRKPDALAAARLSAKFNSWIEQYDAPSMPIASAVIVTK